MKSLIKEEYILFDVSASNKEDLLKTILDMLDIDVVRDKEAVYQSILERESEVSTGFVNGIAIPHAKTNAVNDATVIIAQLKEAVPWETMDGSLVDFVFLIMTPKNNVDNSHLKILAKLAGILMEEEIVKQLKQSNTKQEIIGILEGEL